MIHSGTSSYVFRKMSGLHGYNSPCTNEHLILRYTSPDGENGFPGTLDVTVRYSIENNVFRVIYEASCDQPTHVNLTQHPYFNLRPTDEHIGNHELRLYTSHYLETTPDLIPTGTVLSTDKKHAFDFYKPLFLALQEDGLDDSPVLSASAGVAIA